MPFASDTAVAILSAKRNELDLRRRRLLAEVADLDQSLAHIDGAITILDPTPAILPPPAKARSKGIQDLGLRRGEIGPLAVAVLTEARSPLTTQKIARAILKGRRPATKPTEIERVCRALVSALRRLQEEGVVDQVGQAARGALIWMISPSS